MCKVQSSRSRQDLLVFHIPVSFPVVSISSLKPLQLDCRISTTYQKNKHTPEGRTLASYNQQDETRLSLEKLGFGFSVLYLSLRMNLNSKEKIARWALNPKNLQEGMVVLLLPLSLPAPVSRPTGNQTMVKLRTRKKPKQAPPTGGWKKSPLIQWRIRYPLMLQLLHNCCRLLQQIHRLKSIDWSSSSCSLH